jgi:enoyl-CoA hydratase/carnithine racemase
MADEVLFERRGHVALLTLNRPEARNAINMAMMHELSSALDICESDDSIWVVVLTGSQDKAFCAGMDLKAFAQTGDMPFNDHGFAGITKREFSKPLIAAANGSAFAGGFEVLLSCDLVVSSDQAVFGIPEAQRGLIAGAGGLIRLGKRIPRAVALEMALTADPITAQRALQLGLINTVVESALVLDTALTLAERITRNAPLAVRLSKRVMKASFELDEAGSWPLNDEAFATVANSHDAHEGATAFAEKRDPQWQGR